MPTTIKLGKTEDTVSVIKRIKDLKETEIIFELEKGSILLSSSANLKLLKRTGESLGKKVLVATSDELGRLLAIKAGVLVDQTPEDLKKIMPKVQPPPTKLAAGDMKIKKARPPQPEEPIMPEPARVFPSALAKQYLSTKPASKMAIGKTVKIVSGVLIAVIILAGVAFAVLPKADITVYARSEPITRDLDLRVDKNSTTVDATAMAIPGQLLTKEISQTKNFPVTGTSLSGSKATGKAVITNGTSTTFKLRASTTTLVAGGKNYFFTQDVSGIKPGSNSAVDMVAEQAGESYNVPSGTKFEIKNAALGNQPEVYATASTDIAGGVATATLSLTQADLDAALTKSTEELIATAEAEINQENPGLRLILSGVNKEILAQTANKNIGEAAESFDFTVIARLTGLAYREDDVKNLVSQQIGSVLSEDKYLVEGAKQKIDAEFKSLDLIQGIGMISVHFETLVAYKIDANNLSKILAGKKSSEIKEILLSKPEIDRVDVKFWPFYVRKAPRLNGNVNIKTVLSQL